VPITVPISDFAGEALLILAIAARWSVVNLAFT